MKGGAAARLQTIAGFVRLFQPGGYDALIASRDRLGRPRRRVFWLVESEEPARVDRFMGRNRHLCSEGICELGGDDDGSAVLEFFENARQVPVVRSNKSIENG